MKGSLGAATIALALAAAACNSTPRQDVIEHGASAGTTGAPQTSSTEVAPDGVTSNTTVSADADSTADVDSTADEPKFDLRVQDAGGGRVPTCHVVDDMDAVPECDVQAPPDAFELDVQWTWNGPAGNSESITLALVGNLTDDNDDDSIDLCDVPDVVVTTYEGALPGPGRIFVLDGATGVEHCHTDQEVDGSMSPALGDIDGDGIADIVSRSAGGNLIAFNNDCTLKWLGTAMWPEETARYGAVALADVDGDGSVEILAGNLLVDATGGLLQAFPGSPGAFGYGNSTTAADLDDDGDLEIILGNSAWHHTGANAYDATQLMPGIPSVADLDGDGRPEILLNNSQGFSIIEHDGVVTTADARPTGAFPSDNGWHRPACVHDFDGDGDPEFGVSAVDQYGVFRPDLTWLWLAEVVDFTGIASGTAFDFLGDGQAEAMYGDEQFFYVFDEAGSPLLTQGRSSRTLIEYPVVADVDNDGSAEIVVTSNAGFMGQSAPTVTVLRDVQDRWIAARRIWNQHSYHVTNVREDGTIPAVEPQHWQQLNTFRTNAQIQAGTVCDPPEG